MITLLHPYREFRTAITRKLKINDFYESPRDWTTLREAKLQVFSDLDDVVFEPAEEAYKANGDFNGDFDRFLAERWQPSQHQVDLLRHFVSLYRYFDSGVSRSWCYRNLARAFGRFSYGLGWSVKFDGWADTHGMYTVSDFICRLDDQRALLKAFLCGFYRYSPQYREDPESDRLLCKFLGIAPDFRTKWSDLTGEPGCSFTEIF